MVDISVSPAGSAYCRGSRRARPVQPEVLHLGGTAVGDSGGRHLKRLTRLEKLWLIRTRITDDGLSSIQQSLPVAVILGQVEKDVPLPEIETHIAPG
jgi:hypothetical protein